MSVSERQSLVRDFHRKSGEPINDAPELPDKSQAVLRAKFILEEALELVAALGVEVLLPVVDDGDVHVGYVEMDHLEFHAQFQPDLVAAVDAVCDLSYQIHGVELVLGVADVSDAVFQEVHNTNMAKQIVASSPDGKAVKPPGWKPPNIAGILRKAYPRKALLFRETPR